MSYPQYTIPLLGKRCLLFVVFLAVVVGIEPRITTGADSPVINEISWMGTKSNASDEWIELYNPTDAAIDLTGWGIYEKSGEILVEELTGSIGPFGFHLIERSDDSTISDIPASQSPSPWGGSGLSNSGEHLVLKDAAGNVVDEVNASGGWFAGVASPDYRSMERINPQRSGNDSANWSSNDGSHTAGHDGNSNAIFGTPGSQNSVFSSAGPSSPNTSSPQHSSNNPLPPSQPSNTPPQAKAVLERTEVWIGEKIEFDASQSSDVDTENLTFHWNFGDDETSNEEITTHSYADPGDYNVVLKVSDGQFESYDFVTILVVEPQFSKEVTINEFIPNPEGSDTENEWIELTNKSGETINLSGWRLDDADGGSNAFTVPDETRIDPDGFLVFGRPKTKIALNNDIDAVRLIWPSGEIAEEVTYSESKEGWSVVRTKNGWEWTNTPSPGSENILRKETAIPRDVKPASGLTGSFQRKSIVAPPPDVHGGVPTEENENEGTPLAEGDKKSGEGTAALARPLAPLSRVPYPDVFIALGVALFGSFALYIARKKLKRIE